MRDAHESLSALFGQHFTRWLVRPVEKLGRAATQLTMAQRRTRRDYQLARHLSRVFERDLERSSLQGVQFYVQGGIVTLYGTVAHALDRRLVVDAVRGVAGVEGVVAHLQIIEEKAP